MQNLSDFSKQNNNVNNQRKTNDFNIVELVGKYGNLSQDELVCEFFKQVEKQKEEGSFDKNKIVSIANTLLPFLNSSQKELVNSILNKV